MSEIHKNPGQDNDRPKTQIAVGAEAIAGPLIGTNIGIIGAGFVGCVAAAGFAKFGHNVICIDKDTERVRLLQEGKTPFYEPELEDLIAVGLKSKRLSFAADFDTSIDRLNAIFVTVGTPSLSDGRADLGAIEETVETLAGKLTDRQVLVLKSTVPIGTADRLKGILGGSKKNERMPAIINNPEFLREGSAVYDFFHPQRIVIGGDDAEAMAAIKNIYRLGMIESVSFVMTNNKTAEMIKYASNVFLAMKIGFINEVSRLCDSLEVDVLEVARGMGYDRRIGAEFLNPGPGWGGSCLPKDLNEFLGLAGSHNIRTSILKSVLESNHYQHEYVIRKIAGLIGSLKGKKIAALGATFKANTSDLRDSPAVRIIEMLIEEGAKVVLFDPVADPDDPLWPEGVTWGQSAYEAARNVDCIVILTEWPEFQMLDWKRMAQSVRHRNIVDTRNLLFPDTIKVFDFNYSSMGQL